MFQRSSLSSDSSIRVALCMLFAMQTCFLCQGKQLHGSAPAEMPPSVAAGDWLAGAAKQDITPSEALRLSGYANRIKGTSDIDDRLFVRALSVLHVPTQKALMMVSLDAIGISPEMTMRIEETAARRWKLGRANIVLCSTHAHTAPHLQGTLGNLFSNPLTPEESKATLSYTETVTEKIVLAMEQAIDNRTESTLTIGGDRAEFAINRRLIQNQKWTGFGTVDDGPVDRNVRVLKVVATNGKPVAVAYQYACHCTSISPELNRISGDWAGLSAKSLEEHWSGLVALPLIGAGADANPNPRGKYENAQAHGEAMAQAVIRGWDKALQPLPAPTKVAFSYVGLECERPTKEQLVRETESKGYQERSRANHYLELLKTKDRIPESYPAPVHLWTFGNELAWVFFGGEVVVDYQMRLERELNQFSHVWVAGYVDDVFAYLASERVRREGGYEVDASMIYYNQPGRWVAGTEDKVVRAVLDLQRQQHALHLPRNPKEAMDSFQMAKGWKIDLLVHEPMVEDPINIAFGPSGEVWVLEMGDYPSGGNRRGRVKCLRDTDADGKMDASKVFLDNLDFPSGIYAWRDGVVVACAPEVFLAKDTDRDGVADVRETLLSGFAFANPQHRVHGFTYGIDHRLHFGSGDGTATVRLHKRDGTTEDFDIRGADLALNIDERTLELESGETQFIRTHDGWGNWFGNDNSHPLFHYVNDRHWFELSNRRPRQWAKSITQPASSPPVYPLSHSLDRFNDPFTANRFTSACSTIIVRSPGCGDEMQGAAVVCESVHNLVARFRITPDGVSWQASRFDDERASDWIRSRDPWFRPVRLVNAPDGTIWIADMYRRVIEHPTWIPKEWLDRLDVRSGEDQGRIYRVYRDDFQPIPLVDYTRASIYELVSFLSHPSVAIGDFAQQQIVWRADRDSSIVATLHQLLQPNTEPVARMRAFSILEYWHRLDASDWRRLFQDPDIRIQRYALHRFGLTVKQRKRLEPSTEGFTEDCYLSEERDWIQEILKSGRVELSPQIAIEALYLAGLSSQCDGNRYVNVLLKHHDVAGMEVLLDLIDPSAFDSILTALLESNSTRTAHWIERVLPKVSTVRQSDLVQRIVESTDAVRPAWHFRLAQQLSRNHGAHLELLTPDRLEQLSSHAKQIVSNQNAESAAQFAALDYVLSRMNDSSTLDSEWLLQVATQCDRSHFAIAIVEGVFRLGKGTHAKLLTQMQHWPAELVNPMVSLFLSKTDSTDELLGCLKSGLLSSQLLQPSQIERLRVQQDPAVLQLVESIYGPDQKIPKGAIVADFASRWPAKGGVHDGKQLFEKHCATCHQAREIRGELVPSVGPVLESLNHWTNEQWLVAILDPSRSVDLRFKRWLVRTTSGEIVAGLPLRESEQHTEYLQTDGSIRTILRAEIEESKESTLSLMPDGFDQLLTPEQIASIVGYLRSRE